MKTLGNEIYIQRGEIWSLDFEVKNTKGDPLMLLKDWVNPYLVLTIAAARYDQSGAFSRTWWLDMDKQMVENEDGSYAEDILLKRFIHTQPLYLEEHRMAAINTTYPEIPNEEATDYLFYTDPDKNGKRIYKYLEDAEWKDYNFRIIKLVDTQDMIEQTYLFDIKLIAGNSIQEEMFNEFLVQGDEPPALPWSNEKAISYVENIVDTEKREQFETWLQSGAPLRPPYQVETPLLQPTKFMVGADIQGGIKYA